MSFCLSEAEKCDPTLTAPQIPSSHCLKCSAAAHERLMEGASTLPAVKSMKPSVKDRIKSVVIKWFISITRMDKKWITNNCFSVCDQTETLELSKLLMCAVDQCQLLSPGSESALASQ